MDGDTKNEEDSVHTPTNHLPALVGFTPQTTNSKSQSKDKDSPTPGASAKRRCVSTACIACRRRKSKCDGNTPSCAACSSVYGTECIYDPNSDHRRKGVYKKDIDNLKTRNSTLQTLIQAILNFPENEVPDLVKQIRTCESLDDVAESILARDNGLGEDNGSLDAPVDTGPSPGVPQFEKELSGQLGKRRLDNGSVSIIGGTSNLIFIGAEGEDENTVTSEGSMDDSEEYEQQDDAITSWTEVTTDPELVVHLLNMYFTWHYTYFTTLSKSLFWRDFLLGHSTRNSKRKTEYCTPLLVNAMLALGCHFTSWPRARADPNDSATAGNHFFKEGKRLIMENDEHEKPKLTTVQALALMSVREAGCGREARGWVYSGMSFRMACDLGLNIDSGSADLDEAEVDARRITIWGCFLFDKCWSNYLGRQPQLPLMNIAVPKFDVFPMEDAATWAPYMDSGVGKAPAQPSRTRAVALQTSQLCEISSDILLYFYNPHQLEKPLGRQVELKKLSELHTRLEAWRKHLPKEMEQKENQLPNVLVMHMFFQLLFIHLFRPFLKYKQKSSPLPPHVSPRKFLTQAASTISKLLRLYKRTYGLRQICNIVVYISHSACTVHLLNLPDKNAGRDLVHGLKHLEEIAEGWLCARRTLGILRLVAKRWNIEVPEEAEKTFLRAESKFGSFRDHEMSPKPDHLSSPPTTYQPLSPPLNQTSAEIKQMNDLVQQSNNLNVEVNGYYDVIPIPPMVTVGPSGSINNLAHLPPPSAPEYTNPNPNKSHDLIPQPLHLRSQHQNQNQHQQQSTAWSQRRASSTTQQLTSPTTLFGGVEGLIQDQEWWLRDSNQMFASWNGTEGEGAMPGKGARGGNGNGGFDVVGGGGGGGMVGGYENVHGNGVEQFGGGGLGFPR